MTEEEKQLENFAPAVDSATVSEDQATEPTPVVESVAQDGTTETPLDANLDVGPASLDDTVSTSELVNQEALAQLATEVEALRAQLEERASQYMRIAADFDNFRKRSQKEKEDLEQQAKRNTLSELLPVIDSFERARSQLKPQSEQEANIHKSYQGIYKQLVDCLKRIGVSPMRPEGKMFDPAFHEAVMRESTDQYPEGTVVEELVRGYLIGDRVLRHAMVKVATAPEPTMVSDSAQVE